MLGWWSSVQLGALAVGVTALALARHNAKVTYAPPPPPDHSRKFLNMSGGVLAVVATVILVAVFCVVPALFCGVGVYLLPDPSVTPTP